MGKGSSARYRLQQRRCRIGERRQSFVVAGAACVTPAPTVSLRSPTHIRGGRCLLSYFPPLARGML